MAIWQFTLIDREVQHGGKRRKQLTSCGCNEPFKDRYWCPKKKWFSLEPCPFLNQRECNNFDSMCGRRLAVPEKTGAANT